jgi:TetR/AcrR family transcriptional regulator
MSPKRKSPTAERQRGRPADLESGALQARILDAAENLFAEYGYNATSVRKLADTVGVNPALVHYYFGTKAGLLAAVMDRALEPLARAIAAMQASDSVQVEDVAALLIDMASRHPAMPRLITREVLLGGGDMQALFAERYAPRLGGALPALVRREQDRGRVRPNLDPGAATLMLLGLCMFPFIGRSLAEPVLGIRYDEPGLREYAAQLRLLINGGMTT